MVESAEQCEERWTFQLLKRTRVRQFFTILIFLPVGAVLNCFMSSLESRLQEENLDVVHVEARRKTRRALAEEDCWLSDTDLFLPLHRKDVPLAPPLFKSIELNLPCFNDLVIVVPPDGLDELSLVVPSWARVFVVPEPLPEPGGYLGQQVIKMYADQFTTAGYVFILETDMVFTDWKNECFFADRTKIKAYCIPFEGTDAPRVWKKGTEHALWREVKHECCVHTPFIFPREMFPGLRGWIKEVHKKNFGEFIEDYYEDMIRAWNDEKMLYSEFNIMNQYMFHFMSDRVQLVEPSHPGWDARGTCSKHTGQLVTRNHDLENPKLTNEYYALAGKALNRQVDHERLTLDLSQESLS